MTTPPPKTDRGRPIRVGTRGSVLARCQAALVAEALDHLGWRTEIVPVVTAGDQRPPDTAWGEGAFVGALREALLDGAVDLAVHSAKDVPLDGPSELTIAAYLDRQDPRDVFVLGPTRPDPSPGTAADPLGLLPPGARIGTDSPRRAGFLRAARHDLRVVPIHGNVDTRLRRLDEGEVDALVIAAAGLIRLGRADRITAYLPLDLVPPAPGQGALAVETRTVAASDPVAAARLGALTALDEAAVRRAVEAERLVLARLGGGCRAPIGVAAQIVVDDRAGEESLEILAAVVEPDGRDRRIVVRRGPVADWTAIAVRVADLLVAERRRRRSEATPAVAGRAAAPSCPRG